MPATRVYRILQNDPLRINPDNIWEVGNLYVVTGPASKLDVPSAVDAVTGLQLPYKGTPHPENPFLICSDVSIDWQGSNDTQGDIWQCQVQWRSAGALQATPEPLEWKWEQGIQSEQFDHDVDRKPYVNSSGFPLQGTFPDDVVVPILKVWQTQPLYDPAFAFSIANRVNKVAMTLFGTFALDKEQLRCLYCVPVTNQRHAVQSIRVEYAFEIKDGYRPFQPRAVDQSLFGYYHDGGAEGVGRFFFAGDGTSPPIDPCPEPVLLDGQGVPIDADNFKVGYTTETTPALYSPVVNPNVPDWFDIDPDSPDDATLLIFTRKKPYDFRGMLPPVM